MQATWKPILDGAAGRRAEATLTWIASSLPACDDDPGLAWGASGIALAHAYLGQHLESETHVVQAVRLLETALAQAWSGTTLTMAAGITGTAWSLDHCQRRFVDLDVDPAADVDAALDRLLGQEDPWLEHLTWYKGLAGFAVYALTRMPRPTAVSCVERIVAHLDEAAEYHDDGITWLTPVGHLPTPERAAPPGVSCPCQPTQPQAPAGLYNLGVGRGVPGIIAALAFARAAGVATTVVDRLLDGAVPWLLARQLPEHSPGRFPRWLGPGEGAADPGWCYGDPGIAATLLAAARATNRSAWEAEAIDLAMHSTRRPVDDCGVDQAGLCHGAAGLAHVYNRLWQATDEPAFASAARSWLERALDLVAKCEHPGLMDGPAGVALVLLAALGVDPHWDSLLLLSAPPSQTD